MIRGLAVLALLGALASVGGAQPVATRPGATTTAAPPAEVGPTWASLSVAQRSALAPLQAQWSSLDAARKSKWLVVAQRFPSMPDDERRRVQARMAEWARMSPVERGRARQNFQELRNLPSEDRHALWEAYRALPEEQRRELAQRAKTRPAAASEPVAQSDAKRRVAVNPRAVTVKPVSPTVVQAKPGGTTTLVTKTPTPPPHHQPGMPKILASKDFVNPSTLLPTRGPQGAAVAAPPAASEPQPQP